MLPYLAAMSALSFVLIGWDKQLARRRRFRVPEALLLAAAALGGSAGTGLGMLAFHHKTRKPLFYLSVPILFLLQTAAAAYFYSR